MKTLYQRKSSIRLKGYDYSNAGCYFVTICTKYRDCLFGSIKDGKMVLNEYGLIAENELNNLSNHYENVNVDIFVVMPNHIHLIVSLLLNPVGTGLAPVRNEKTLNANETLTIDERTTGDERATARVAPNTRKLSTQKFPIEQL